MSSQAASPPSRGRIGRAVDWMLAITVARLLKWLLALAAIAAVLAAVGFYVFVVYPANHIPAMERVDGYVYLDQGWGTRADSPGRQAYYYTAQGTSMPQGALVTPLRYRWFTALEMPFGRERFVAPEHLRRYRFIVDPEPTLANPDRLPVGFTRHYDGTLGEDVVDITCAACHTGEIHARKDGKTLAIRIDGGQAMHAFTDMQTGAFGPTLVASMAATLINPAKFDRFARKVIGLRYPDGKDALRADLAGTIEAFATQGQNSPLRHLYPVREGFGRTDALGRIANTVFGDHLIAGNYLAGVAPVSYPYVWNIWKFDWVQYNGSVSQPLARNIGEALGVGAVLRMTDNYGNPVPAAQRFDSSVNIENLGTIEHTLQTLTPPRWPEELLGRIDQAKAARGKVLFESRCAMCHGPHPVDRAQQLASAPGKPSPDVEWAIEVIPLQHIGTDPTEASGFVTRRYDLRPTGLTRRELSDLLRPQLLRNLARDARWRLSETVDGRTKAGLGVGTLPTLLAEYPDPDVNELPSISHASFAAIAAQLQVLPPAPLSVSPWSCDLGCQQAALLKDVTTGESDIDAQLGKLDVGKITEGEGLNILGMLIKRKYFTDHRASYARQQCMEGFGTLDLPQQIAGYKPRPLEGVWATPPFLHNGSVPTIYQMLLPPEQRDKTFTVGNRLYDATHLGFSTAPVAGGFVLDTSIAGNHNTGHAFVATPAQLAANEADPKAHPLPPGVIGPLLSDEERYAILEYLKVHRDLPATPTDFRPADCGP
jgi:cytochrome c5